MSFTKSKKWIQCYVALKITIKSTEQLRRVLQSYGHICDECWRLQPQQVSPAGIGSVGAGLHAAALISGHWRSSMDNHWPRVH